MERVLKHLKALRVKGKREAFEDVAIGGITDGYTSEQFMKLSTTTLMEKNTEDL